MVGQGTTTYTVASIMERLYQSYLTPPDQQGSQVWLGTAVDDSETTFTLGSFAIPEDEALLRQASVLEADQELLRVVSYDPDTPSVEVLRNEMGTVAAAHGIPTLLTLNPPYPRSAVFEAVADNISLLHPKLFTVVQEYLPHIGNDVYPVQDSLVVFIQSAWLDSADTNINSMYPREVDWLRPSTKVDTQFVKHHPDADGPAVIARVGGENLWVTMKRKIGRPTAETDTLSSIGVDERWVNIIMAGAAADLLVGRDLSASHTEWVQNVIEAENIRVGTRMSLAGGLRQYRNMLLEDTAKEIRSAAKKRVRMRDPFAEAQ